MPIKQILTGFSISVLDSPPVPGTDGKPGKCIILTDNTPPYNSLVFAISNSIAKDTGHKLIGNGKVKTATPEEIAQMATMLSNGRP